jgi:CheY-like chemotaxis protein
MTKVLIVDDNEYFLKVACSLIESQGHECIKASNVSEAIRLATDANPECFILDIRLGETELGKKSPDGVKLFEKLKELIKRCRVIFASAHTDYKEGYLLRRGATILIDKPNFRKEITRALHEVFYPRVLLVEDNVAFASIASAILRARGIKCVPITDKAEMVKHVKECDLSTFDIVLTDVILNGKDNFHGWDVVNHILPSFPKDSIFLLTEKSKAEIEQQIGRRFDDLQTRRELLSAISHLSEQQVLDKEGEAWIGAIEMACSEKRSYKAQQ